MPGQPNGPRRILIVSVRPTAHEISCSIQPLGELVVCESAGRALTVLGEQAFDCIVSSMELPDMHATELLAELRRRAVRIPVLVVTDPSSIPDTVSVMRAGARHVVEAPPYGSALRERAARLLGLRG
jgi:DNA-binding NtrC family response regulator